jgi:glucose/arabinose dehydrogenase
MEPIFQPKTFFMKRYSLLITVSVIALLACKKQINTSTTEDEIATHRNHDGKELQTRVIVNNLNFPWEIVWGPDNYIWMTERQGRVSRVNPRTGQVIPVATIAEVASTTNFNGLLGMVLHPNFRYSHLCMWFTIISTLRARIWKK